MLHAGLDLSRNRIDVCLLAEGGELVAQFATPSDGDGVAGLARRVLKFGEPVQGVIESMTGARFVHDTLERFGWDVLIADAQKVKGLAPLGPVSYSVQATVQALGVLARWISTFVIVVVGVKPVWLHFGASVVIVPLRLTLTPAVRDVAVTPEPNVTSAWLSV